MSGLMTLPLSKFSLAIDSISAQAFSWNHITCDLAVILDGFHSSPVDPCSRNSKVMRVVQGTRTVEVVEIGKLVEAAQLRARENLVGQRSGKQPINALHRCPLLALKFHISENMIKRIQLKFNTKQDFLAAFNFLGSTGWPMLHSPQGGVAGGQKVLRNPSQALLPDTFGESPTLGRSSMQALRQEAHSIAAPALDCHVDTPESLMKEPREALTFLKGSKVPSREAVFHEAREEVQTDPSRTERPLTSSSYFTTQSTSTLRPSSAITITSKKLLFNNNINVPESQSPQGASLQTGQTGLTSDASVPYARSSEAVSCIHDTAAAFDVTERALEPEQDVSEALPKPGQRPSTAPARQLQETLRSSIPPRRKLPFRKTTNTEKRSAASGATGDSNIVADLPPLPKPKMIADAKTSCPLGATAANFHSSEFRNQVSQPATPPDRSNDPTDNASYGAHDALFIEGAEMPTTDENRTDIVNTETQGLLNTATAERAPPKAALHRLDNILAREEKPPCGDGVNSLKGYAAQSYEERRAVLDDTFTSLIMNEDFMTLCEDVESCWTRIALGL